jgi:hypothetical protein
MAVCVLQLDTPVLVGIWLPHLFERGADRTSANPYPTRPVIYTTAMPEVQASPAGIARPVPLLAVASPDPDVLAKVPPARLLPGGVIETIGIYASGQLEPLREKVATATTSDLIADVVGRGQLVLAHGRS